MSIFIGHARPPRVGRVILIFIVASQFAYSIFAFLYHNDIAYLNWTIMYAAILIVYVFIVNF